MPVPVISVGVCVAVDVDGAHLFGSFGLGLERVVDVADGFFDRFDRVAEFEALAGVDARVCVACDAGDGPWDCVPGRRKWLGLGRRFAAILGILGIKDHRGKCWRSRQQDEL